MDTYRKNLVNKVGQFASRDRAILPIQGGSTHGVLILCNSSFDLAILPIQQGKSMEDATHGVLTLCSLYLFTWPYCLSSRVESREDKTHGVITLSSSHLVTGPYCFSRRVHGGYKPWRAYSM